MAPRHRYVVRHERRGKNLNIRGVVEDKGTNLVTPSSAATMLTGTADSASDILHITAAALKSLSASGPEWTFLSRHENDDSRLRSLDGHSHPAHRPRRRRRCL